MSEEFRQNGENSVRILVDDFVDLGLLVEGCRNQLRKLRDGDYELSARFRALYDKYNSDEHAYVKIKFYQFYAELWRSEDRSAAVPASVFREAAEVVALFKAVQFYNSFVMSCLEGNGYSKKERDDLITRSRGGSLSLQEEETIRSHFKSLLAEEYPTAGVDNIAIAADRVFRFLTDYKWWCGSKFIYRDDFLVSMVCQVMGKAAASSEIVKFIVEDYSKDALLWSAARELSRFNSEMAAEVIGPDRTERLKTGVNNIIYGAPGTGKSWFVEHDLHPDAVTSRVVFHPEYSYYDFVGSYKPTPVYSTDGPAFLEFSGQDAAIPGTPHIDYRFEPGPFVEAVLKANDDPCHEHCLIIEEINRGDAASIFGDMFQILDRDDNHASAYGVKPQPELAHYLMHAGYRQLASSFRIPSNLSLAATMNSSDLAVTYLDTAFKRRWRYVYRRIRLEANDSLNKEIKYNDRSCTLFDLLTAINKKMSQLHVGEDRWVGPFFITPLEIKSGGASQAFEKVVMYLWDDVFRNERSKFFDVEMSSLAEVIAKMVDSDPLQIEDFFAVGTGFFDSEN